METFRRVVIVGAPLPAEEEAKPFPSAGQSTPWPSVKLRAIIGWLWVPLLVATSDFLVIRKWLFKVKTSRWRSVSIKSRKFQSLSPLVVASSLLTIFYQSVYFHFGRFFFCSTNHVMVITTSVIARSTCELILPQCP